MRIDKLTLAGLEATLREYLDGARGIKNLPVLDMLLSSAQELERRGKRLRRKLIGDVSSLCEVNLKKETSQVGGGALPLQDLATIVIALRPLRTSAANLAVRLRNGDPPVIARVKEEEVLLDLRTVAKREEKALLEGVRQALKK